MKVIKRNSNDQLFNMKKVLNRLKILSSDLSKFVKPELIANKTKAGLYNGVKTGVLDELLQQECGYLAPTHSDYAVLGGRLVATDIWKTTESTFSGAMKLLYKNICKETKEHSPLISKDVYEIIMKNRKRLNDAIVMSRDLTHDYFGMMTLKKSYLLKSKDDIAERPQYLWMRVSIGIHKEDIDAAIETYEFLSTGIFIHATPTLFNSGTMKPQMSSCFLVTIKDDSLAGIYFTLKDSAIISKSSGGLGISVHKVRARGSYIKGTNGHSDGIVPMLSNYNATARYANQGGGKRKGSFAIYLSPWHADIYEFLDLKKNTGKEELRARDLFYALWISDLFMERVKSNGTWSLFCPNEAKGLADVWGKEFENLYTKYEKQGKARKVVKAQHLWFAILDAQSETGTPYILYKDSVNRKTNQQNLGTIRSSNLCCEIMQYTAPDEIAVCNLASVALPKFVEKDGSFNHKRLFKAVSVMTKNLNKVIDLNYYPVPEAKKSNHRHRPIGVGVQGLADVFFKLGIAYGSKESKKLNSEIFETIYYAALYTSHGLAKKNGPYSSFKGSPISKGIFQFDMWGVKPDSGRWDWDGLRKRIMKDGVRNSLLTAPMPTATSSQILGNTECFEPKTSNLYVRRVLSGEFPVINKYLVKALEEKNLWTPYIINRIKAANGSIQAIDKIPKEIKEVFKTVWEIKQRTLIDMDADRACYVDQSMSSNRYLASPNIEQLTSMHFYAWKKGLKTGQYYLRTQAAAEPIKFTVDTGMLTVEKENKKPLIYKKKQKKYICTDEICITCGS